jgi:hypothetical protein
VSNAAKLPAKASEKKMIVSRPELTSEEKAGACHQESRAGSDGDPGAGEEHRQHHGHGKAAHHHQTRPRRPEGPVGKVGD